MIVVGTRPEIIKMAPVIREILKKDIELQLIHTGQHYDYNMSQAFFDDLHLPYPDFNLSVRSGTNLYHLTTMINKLSELVDRLEPDIILAQGDTNSVLATSLVCIKKDVLFGHVEAGIRSFDCTMPEEINRKLSSISANMHFAPTNNAVINLLSEGIDPDRIYLTGNTIVDATLQHLEIIERYNSEELKDIYNFIHKEDFILCTLHRPSNVDNYRTLVEILKSFEILSKKGKKIVFPIHPRTYKNLEKNDLLSQFYKIPNLLFTKPLNYLGFLKLMRDCSLILTDSGGIQEEAITLKKKCVTLRTNTERPESISVGYNVLCKTEAKEITEKVTKQLDNLNEKLEFENPFGDGTASKKIVNLIIDNITKVKFKSPTFNKYGTKILKHHNVTKKILKDVFEKRHGKIQLIFDSNGNPISIHPVLEKGYNIIYFEQ